MEVARLVLRQDPGSEANTTPVCTGSNDYDGRMGVRISSIFVIFVGSLWGKSSTFHCVSHADITSFQLGIPTAIAPSVDHMICLHLSV